MMSHPHFATSAALDAAYVEASRKLFYPSGTVRCSGNPLFRTRAARDLGCILDVDPAVVAWLCLPFEFQTEHGFHVPDFLVEYERGRPVLLDAVEGSESAEIREGAALFRYDYRGVPRKEIESGFRLANARYLLAYADCQTPLTDRIRMLSALDGAGSLRISECQHIFTKVGAMTGICWMALHRLIEIDLDAEMINPETVVRRLQR